VVTVYCHWTYLHSGKVRLDFKTMSLLGVSSLLKHFTKTMFERAKAGAAPPTA